MARPVNRIPPRLPPQAYKTYAIARPAPTHFRFASCREVDCQAYAHGWETRLDVSTVQGRQSAAYLRMHAGRRYTCRQAGDLVVFRFPPGQLCFRCPPARLVGRDARAMPELIGRVHMLPLEREPIFAVHGGDWRGNPAGVRTVRFPGARAYLDDFGEHQQRLAERLNRG